LNQVAFDVGVPLGAQDEADIGLRKPERARRLIGAFRGVVRRPAAAHMDRQNRLVGMACGHPRESLRRSVRRVGAEVECRHGTQLDDAVQYRQHCGAVDGVAVLGRVHFHDREAELPDARFGDLHRTVQPASFRISPAGWDEARGEPARRIADVGVGRQERRRILVRMIRARRAGRVLPD
jgi:hypothetical protein